MKESNEGLKSKVLKVGVSSTQSQYVPPLTVTALAGNSFSGICRSVDPDLRKNENNQPLSLGIT